MANYQLIYTLLKTNTWQGITKLEAKIGACALHTFPERIADANNKSYGNYQIINPSLCLPKNYHTNIKPSNPKQEPLTANNVNKVSDPFSPWKPSHLSYHFILLKPSACDNSLFNLELEVHSLLEQKGCSVSDRASFDGVGYKRCRELFLATNIELEEAFKTVSGNYPQICFDA